MNYELTVHLKGTRRVRQAVTTEQRLRALQKDLAKGKQRSIEFVAEDGSLTVVPLSSVAYIEAWPLSE